MKIIPNWCSNFLTIEPTNASKKAKAQLCKFFSDIRDEGTSMKFKDAEKYREKFMQENFETRYRDAADVFVAHGEMPIIDFMKRVCEFSYKEETKTFVIGEEYFSMNKLLPVPLELLHPDAESYGGLDAKEKDELREQLVKKYGYASWYDWRIANYGCKWGVHAEIDKNEDSVSYIFESAWSPPVEFLKNICERYLLLRFHLNYEEPGCNFEGDLIIENGEIIQDETREYSGGEDDDEG